MTALLIVLLGGVIVWAWIAWETREKPGEGPIDDSTLKELIQQNERELQRLKSSIDSINPDPHLVAQVKKVEYMIAMNKMLLEGNRIKKAELKKARDNLKS